MNKILKSFILTLILLISSSGVANASIFQDSFEDQTYNAWDYVIGGTILTPSPIDGGYYDSRGVSGNLLQKNITANTNYWKFDWRPIAAGGTIFYRYSGTGTTDKCSLALGISSVAAANTGTCLGLTAITSLTASQINSLYWYRVEITDMGSTMNYVFTNLSNGTVISTQNVADTTTSTTNNAIKLQSTSASTFYFDNIVVDGVSPTASTVISWNQNQYNINDVGTISYTISSSFWDFISSYKIDIIKDGNVVKTFEGITQSGTVQYQFISQGAYEAQLVKTILFVSDTQLGSDTAYVVKVNDYIFVNNGVPVGVPFNVSYKYGSTPAIQGELNSFILEFFNNGDFESYKTVSVGNNAIDGGTTYTTNISVSKEGLFRIWLFDPSKGKLTSTTFTAVAGSITPETNITRSYIRLDNTVYGSGDLMIANIGIDNTNYTNSSRSKYLIAYNYDTGEYSPVTFELIRQVDTIQFYVDDLRLDNGNLTLIMQYTAGGSNFNITNTNFSITSINNEGYGITMDKTTVCPSDKVKFGLFAPGRAIYEVEWNSPKVSSIILDNKSFNMNLTRYFQFPNFVGWYDIRIKEESTGDWKITKSITVKECKENATLPGATPPTAQSQTDDLLSSGMFMALVFMILFGGMGAMIGGLGGTIIGFSAGFIFSSIYGLVPVWALFLFAIVVILVFAIFAGKGWSGGGND